MMKSFFPVAVWYGENRARAPMMPKTGIDIERTKKDLENIRKLGFNSVRYWVDWATCESEYERYNFDQIENFLDNTARYDLKVIIQIYLDSAPNWLAIRYPDGLYISHTGHKVESQASPGYSLDHPAIRERATKFMQKIAQVVKNKPNFYGWDVWSEPHIVNWSWFDYMGVKPWFDYNKHSQKRFRNWLKKKYRSLDELNEKWYRTYRSWDEIKAPKYVTLSTFTDLMDWQKFNLEKLQEDLLWRYETIKKADPEHIITSHSAISSLYESPIGGSPDDWKMAKVVDVWGTSFYPKHVGWLMPLDYALKGFAVDATRCASQSNGKSFWIGELQSGHGVVGMNFGEPVRKEDVVQWAWISVSRGAKGLCYYAYYPMSCGEEISGFGLVHPDGTLTDRAETAGNIGKVINKNQKLFIEAKSLKSEVAIVYNIYSYMMLSALREKDNELIRSSVLGLYRFLTHKGIQTDFVTTEEIKKGTLKNYKLVFAPLSIALNQETANEIKKYVENGGTFVSEFRPGWSDIDGRGETKIPGMGLNEIFGCYETWWRKVKGAKIVLKDSDFDDLTILNNGYEEAFALDGGNTIGRFNDGSPAIVKNKFGKGMAIVIGALLSREYEKTRDQGIEKFFREILKIANVSSLSSPIHISNPNVFIETRLLEFKNGYIAFFFNHDASNEVNSTVILYKLTENYTAFDLINEKTIPCRSEKAGLVVDVNLKPSEVLVLRLSKD